MFFQSYFYVMRHIIKLCLLFLSCIPIWESWHYETMEDIRKRGKLRVILPFNESSFFIYKEEKMGFEYELLELLAKDLNLELELIPAKNLENLPYLLNSQPADLVAANIAITRERERELKFTEHFLTTRQVLIQRKKDNEYPDVYIQSVLDLIGKKVYVIKKSSYSHRLKYLQEEIGGKIFIEEIAGDTDIDELILKVHEGEIDYTIADETIAFINQTYYENLDTSVAVSFPQKIGWVVRRNAPELQKEINKWIYKIRGNGTLEKIKNKYYVEQKIILEDEKTEDSFVLAQVSEKEQIPFAYIIQTEAKNLDWDWRLLASVIYKESQFKVNARSWAGALGLMQIMPSTAKIFGVTTKSLLIPEVNISIGVRHLQYLQKLWSKIPNKEQRIKFILASYNAGQGHIQDARVLAIKKGLNPNVWDGNVEKTVLLLSNPDYYNLEEIRFGYCRGRETYEYVRKIFQKYQSMK